MGKELGKIRADKGKKVAAFSYGTGTSAARGEVSSRIIALISDLGAKDYFVGATFGDVRPSENLCYIGSTGSLEIAKNMGNLAETLEARPGDKVTLRRCVKKRTARSKKW